MALFKGKDVEYRRAPGCGWMIKWYPVKPINDLATFLTVKGSSAEEDKWEFQSHYHKDFEEYWFVIEGKGQVIEGDKIFDVEPGDLIITPPGVPHKAKGDMTFICCGVKHNVYGYTMGAKINHVGVDRPYRDKPEEMLKVGVYDELDLSSGENPLPASS